MSAKDDIVAISRVIELVDQDSPLHTVLESDVGKTFVVSKASITKYLANLADRTRERDEEETRNVKVGRAYCGNPVVQLDGEPSQDFSLRVGVKARQIVAEVSGYDYTERSHEHNVLVGRRIRDRLDNYRLAGEAWSRYYARVGKMIREEVAAC